MGDPPRRERPRGLGSVARCDGGAGDSGEAMPDFPRSHVFGVTRRKGAKRSRARGCEVGIE